MPEPLKLLEELSPITHFIASTIFDFPEPFGPMIPFKPVFIDSEVSSENDLNPDNRNLLIYNVITQIKKYYTTCSMTKQRI